MDAYLSSIWVFAFNFAPRGWAQCNGQLMSIQQNAALFSLLGTSFGGNGTTTFALPDLRGRIPLGTGQGPGLSFYVLGQNSGSENVSILYSNMPTHTHLVTSPGSVPVSTADAGSAAPTSNFYAYGGTTRAPLNFYATTGTNPMAPNVGNSGATGNNQAVALKNPYTVLNYCVCTQGLYPSRN